MIGMISFSVLNEKWTRKITNHYMEQEKIKKVRKSLVTSGFFKNPVISFSVLRATNLVGTRLRGFLFALTCFKNRILQKSPTSCSFARFYSHPAHRNHLKTLHTAKSTDSDILTAYFSPVSLVPYFLVIRKIFPSH